MTLQKITDKIILDNMVNFGLYNTWLVDIRAFSLYMYEIKQYLSGAESRKSSEIRDVQAEQLFCLRKGITRIILSGFLDIPPGELKYEYDINGKPFISSCGYEDFYFNISHSKEYLFVGITKNGHIGVDIEKVNPKLNHSLLAGSVFSPRELSLYDSYDKPDKLRSFYKAWVQKEAVGKALGMGISIGFSSFSVSIDPQAFEEEYNLSLESLNSVLKVRVNYNNDCALAIALISKKECTL